MMLSLVAAALAVCQVESYVQDLNCNGVDVVDEVPVDLGDPQCAGQMNASNVPYPNADYYYDYVSYGCLVAVAGLDEDSDGLSAGDLALMPDEAFPDLIVTLTCDNCPYVWNRDQYDTDCDNVGDPCDVCPETYDPDQNDADHDGLGDECDSCRYVADVPQEDYDDDSFGDACDNCPDLANDQADDDDDGVGDDCDDCWLDFDPVQLDHDLDGVGDACDSCPDAYDPGQEDADQDDVGDACDLCPQASGSQADADGDGVGDACDICRSYPDTAQRDSDNDQRGDACDTCPTEFDPRQLDSDLDGVGDACDDCWNVYDPDQLDADADGQGDACQPCLGTGWDPGECATYAARGGASTCGTPGPAGLWWVGVALLFARRRALVRRPWVWLALLSGCGFIPAGEREWRLDPDADGVDWPEDCNSEDPTVVGGAPWFLDEDGDGWGAGEAQTGCVTPGEGWVRGGEDCDDADPYVNPSASELCDGLDQDCDDDVDEGFPLFPVYTDADGDGYGAASAGEACAALEGTAASSGDCDDVVYATHPLADEICDAADNDCDGLIDEALLAIWWMDGDRDGFGDPTSGIETCAPDAGYVARGEDCDDAFADTYPYAPEICGNGRDNDCNGVVDDEYTRWTDSDGDGFGDPSTARTACDGDRHEVDNGVDCDDTNAMVNPALPEVCDDGLDNDCDGDDDACEAG